MEQIKLAVVEDDPVIKESLETLFNMNRAIDLKIAAGSVELFMDAFEKLNAEDIGMVLLDIGLPGMSGLDGIAKIKTKFPEVVIVMFTTFEEEDKIFKALCNGACSYITKRTSLMKLTEALFTIHRGGSYMSPSIARKVVQYFAPKPKVETKSTLTTRQREIVDLIVEGLSYKMVADKLSISIETVRDHIKKIYRTLHINSKGELIKKSLDGSI